MSAPSGGSGYTLITGGAGFIGSNLADTLLRGGARVVVADNLSREGVRLNAEWLSRNHAGRVEIEEADVRDAAAMRTLVAGAECVYHLAAQVAVTTSLLDPASDLQTNLVGTFNVLEAARARATPPPVLFTSTNKVYGGIEAVPVELAGIAYRYADGRCGIDEAQPLDFHSPYGCSKGAADQYVRDYARIFRLPTVVFRMSCVYGTRQFGTEDQGWVAHFARSILAGQPITLFGDGCQVRDLLWVDDLVEAMRTALQRIDRTAGEIFNVGGGAPNAVSVRAVIDRLVSVIGRPVEVHGADWRPGDQRIYVSATQKAERMLGWRPRTPWQEGMGRLVDWLESGDLASAPSVGTGPMLAEAAP
jgi:CDP-paratose 2-epimerase